jgi:hypothetical protein
MKTIDFKTPFSVGEESITRAEITNLSFVKFADISRRAVNARKPNQKLQVITQRFRMIEQTTLVTSSGKKIKLTEDQVMKLPPLVGRDIVDALFFDDEVAGTLLSDPKADGVSIAIHYQLGTPIKGANGKDIPEIEFIVKDFGALEEIIAGDASLFQTVDLISTVARPAGGTMLALPSWAADQITLADGIMIMNNILPRFLE